MIKVLSLALPTLENNTADADRLKGALINQLKVHSLDIEFPLLKMLPEILRKDAYRIRCLLINDYQRWRVIHIVGANDTGPFAGLSLILSDFGPALETENWLRNLGFIAILSILGSGVALSLYNMLILRTSPIFAVSVTYLAPIVSTLWGLVDAESITSFMIISVICILFGVYLTIRDNSGTGKDVNDQGKKSKI